MTLQDYTTEELRAELMRRSDLAKAEKAYSTALKEFTEKYSEGFHLTLKDGDVETVITSTTSDTTAKPVKTYDLFNVFDWIDYLF